jgi:hypothetical protein
MENLDELKNEIAIQTELVRLLNENIALSLGQSCEISQTSPRPGKYVHVSLIKTAVRLLEREHHGTFTAQDAARIPGLIISYGVQFDRDAEQHDVDREFREVFGEICS